jgi:predicted DNA-binding mobile mystery protein A
MKTNFPKLKLRQLDAAPGPLAQRRLAAAPTVRLDQGHPRGLGMAAAHLASPRLGVTTSTVIRLESSEADDTISLATLRRAAEALGCELRYALVPKAALADTLESRAMSLARQQMAAVSHTMALEAQSTSRETVEAQTRALAEELLKARACPVEESSEIRDGSCRPTHDRQRLDYPPAPRRSMRTNWPA